MDIADFDQDGHLDLAVTSFKESNVGVYIGRGDGTFEARLIYGTGLGCQSVAKGDFDQDGRIDLAVVNGRVGTIGFLRNLGGGAFATAVDATMYAGVTKPADFDGDHKDELLIGGSGRTSILTLGTSVPPAVEVPVVFDSLRDVAPADFDRDGTLDLATSGINSIVIAYSAADVDKRTLRTFATSVDAGRLVAADFNQDGAPDLATVVWENSGYREAAVAVFLNDGNGGIGYLGSYTVTEWYSLSVGDLNGDGIPDLVGVDGTRLQILTGTGDGGFIHNRFWPIEQRNKGLVLSEWWLGEIAIGDLNGDGKSDVVVANPSSNTLSVFLTSS